MSRTSPLLGVLVLALSAALTACGLGDRGDRDDNPGDAAQPPTTEAGTDTDTGTTAPDPGPGCGERLSAELTPRQRAGQLLMVGLHSGESVSALADQVREQGLGGVFYLGTWSGASAVAEASAELQPHDSDGVRPLIAADQEGGRVQRLVGEGFTTIPTARQQGRVGHRELTARWESWAQELKDAGVDVNLAPVADTVPDELGAGNAPVGALERDFVPGSSRGNAAYVAAAVRGMSAAGVASTLKHFPGLGRVRGNTDHASRGITDRRTTADDRALRPFRLGIRAGAPMVMLSSAVYPRIDPDAPAMFSEEVITGVLRQRLGFDGVVVSDDVGAARAVADVPVGERATRFIAAGGDLVLTASAGQTRTMIDAIHERQRADARFAQRLERAAARVLDLKVQWGLASC